MRNTPKGGIPKATEGAWWVRLKHEPRITVSFSLPAQDRWVLEAIDGLARMERMRGGRSQLIKKALLEYLNRHGEGNPQMALTALAAPSQSIGLVEAGVISLRRKCRLGYGRISQITDLSFRRVRQICRECPPCKAERRRGSFPLTKYQKAWRKLLAGVKFDEAFRFT